AFTWDGRTKGTTIGTAQVITGTTYVLAGAGAGLLESVQTTSGEEYTRIGNTACGNGVPNASLTAAPTSGTTPLTVNFDASGSSVPQSCNTIASFTLDFGDGSAGTQSLPAFSHTYNNAGDYTARLTVTDTAGRSSTNNAQVVIHVASASPSPTPTPTPTASGTQVIQGTYDPHKYPCGSDKLTFNVGPGKASIVIQANATVPSNDISVSLLYNHDGQTDLIKTEDTGTCCEVLRYAPAGQVPPGEYQVQIC